MRKSSLLTILSTIISSQRVFLSCWLVVLVFYSHECSGFVQVGTHGIIIEFTDPNYNTKRNATYLPEVAAHEGDFLPPSLSLMRSVVPLVCLRFSGAFGTD